MKRTELKKLIKENITDWLSERATKEVDSGNMAEKAPVKEEKSTFDDKITKDGNIYLVVKPDKDTAEGGIVRSISLESLIGGGYVGAYTTGEKALAAGKKALKARDAEMKETYKKGQDKLKTMEASIDEIKKQIEGKMSEATSNPDMREALTSESNGLMEKLSMLEMQMDKLREALEKEGLRFEKKSSKKSKKDDDKKDDKKDDDKKSEKEDK
jgi:hypothetical protein